MFSEVFNVLLLKPMMSFEFFPQYATFFFGNTNVCSISTFKNKISKITQPLNQIIMRKYGVQSTKVICWNRFSFLFSIYDINIFNKRLNILEYPEFVVIGKEFRFTMELFYLGVNKFRYVGNCFGERLR